MNNIAENIIEITWVFNDLWNSEKIMKELPFTRESTFASFKEDCVKWAEEFENTYFALENQDYIDNITKFAEEKIIKKYGIKKEFRITYTEIVEASTIKEAEKIANKNAGLMFAIQNIEEID